jgi:general stress protein 26
MAGQHSREEMLALLEEARPAYFTTVDREGYPHTRALFNLHNKAQWPGLAPFLGRERDAFVLYFGTNMSSAKVAQARAHPQVAAYYCDPAGYRGLLLQGRAEAVADLAVKRALWCEGWEKYYAGGAEDPDYIVLRVRPFLATYYHGLRVTALELPGAK